MKGVGEKALLTLLQIPFPSGLTQAAAVSAPAANPLPEHRLRSSGKPHLHSGRSRLKGKSLLGAVMKIVLTLSEGLSPRGLQPTLETDAVNHTALKTGLQRAGAKSDTRSELNHVELFLFSKRDGNAPKSLQSLPLGEETMGSFFSSLYLSVFSTVCISFMVKTTFLV